MEDFQRNLQLDGAPYPCPEEVSALKLQLEARCREIIELRQKLEIRNLSLERLQAQFTIAADAVNRLLAERERVRQSFWARCGMVLGLLPRLKDDLE